MRDVHRSSIVCAHANRAALVIVSSFSASMALSDVLPIDPLPGFFEAAAVRVSDDGTTIVGWSSENTAFRWFVRNSTGTYSIALTESSFERMSADGTTTIWRTYESDQTRFHAWTAANGLTPLTLPGYRASGNFLMSEDGRTIAGSLTTISGVTKTIPFVWTAAQGIQALTLPPGELQGEIQAISSNGDYIVGGTCTGPSGCRAFLWDARRQPHSVDAPSGTIAGEIYAVSADGKVVAGTTYAAAANSTILPTFFAWTPENGTELLLVPAATRSIGSLLVSADTRTLAGDSVTADGRRAFVWTPVDGLTPINPLLGDHSVSMTELSADGSTVAGSSYDAGNVAARGFIWTRGGVQVVETLPGTTSRVHGLSPDGQVATGYFYGAGGFNVAYAHTTANGTEQLLLPGDSYSVGGLQPGTSAVIGDSCRVAEGRLPNCRLMIWTVERGLREIHPLPGDSVAFIQEVSDDGNVAIGTSFGSGSQRAFAWTPTEGTVPVILPGDVRSFLEDLTPDGTAAVGGSCADAFGACKGLIWTSSVAFAPNEVATPTGTRVSVEPVVALPDGRLTATVQIVFDSVQARGTTTVTAASNPSGTPIAPPGFKVGTPPVYYDVRTSARFNESVTLCFPWQQGQFRNESSIKLFHHENGAWRNVTSDLDTTVNRVCGVVTSLSPFAIFETSYRFPRFFPVARQSSGP